jgi:hypothetical protein
MRLVALKNSDYRDKTALKEWNESLIRQNSLIGIMEGIFPNSDFFLPIMRKK